MKPLVPLYAAIPLMAFAIPGAAQAAPGNLMEMTVTSKMNGMGTGAPHTSKYTTCVATDKPDARAMFEDMGCTVSNYKQVGNDISGRVTCPGPPPMNGEGHYSWAGGNFHGQVHLTGTANGQTLSADNTLDGKKIGSCSYTPR